MDDTTQGAQTLTQRIGERIRGERRRLGWSLRELADRTDGTLEKSRISNYEQGIRRPSIEVATQLAEIFGTVSATWLLCLDDSDPLSDAEHRLLALYRAADARGQAIIFSIARAVCDTTPPQQES